MIDVFDPAARGARPASSDASGRGVGVDRRSVGREPERAGAASARWRDACAAGPVVVRTTIEGGTTSRRTVERPSNRSKQQTDRERAHRHPRLVDRRQPDVVQRSERGVVEADQRHIAGDRHPLVLQPVEGADRTEVVGGVDRGREAVGREEHLDAVDPRLLGEVAGDDAAPGRRGPWFASPSGIRPSAVPRPRPRPPSMWAMSPCPSLARWRTASSEPRRSSVLTVSTRLDRSGRPTDTTAVLAPTLVDASGGKAAAGKDHAVDAVREERLDGAVLRPRGAAAVGDDDLVTGLLGRVVDPVGDLREPRVVEIVQQHAERRRSPAGEVSGCHVRSVSEAFGGLLDRRPRAIADTG